MKNYTKKFKEEMAFFINPATKRVTYNSKCKKCIHNCKQSYRTKVVCCHEFENLSAAVGEI